MMGASRINTTTITWDGISRLLSHTLSVLLYHSLVFVGTLGPHVSKSAKDLGQCGWLLSFVSSFVVYYVLCKIWPTKNQRLVKEMGLRWEEMGLRELVAEDGTLITKDLVGHSDAKQYMVEDDEKHLRTRGDKDLRTENV